LHYVGVSLSVGLLRMAYVKEKGGDDSKTYSHALHTHSSLTGPFNLHPNSHSASQDSILTIQHPL